MGFGSSRKKIEYFELRSLEWVGGFGVGEQFWNKRNEERAKARSSSFGNVFEKSKSK